MRRFGYALVAACVLLAGGAAVANECYPQQTIVDQVKQHPSVAGHQFLTDAEVKRVAAFLAENEAAGADATTMFMAHLLDGNSVLFLVKDGCVTGYYVLSGEVLDRIKAVMADPPVS